MSTSPAPLPRLDPPCTCTEAVLCASCFAQRRRIGRLYGVEWGAEGEEYGRVVSTFQDADGTQVTIRQREGLPPEIWINGVKQ
jgi:hypothetical protein